MGLYDVPTFMSLLGLAIGMLFMPLLGLAIGMLYMLVGYMSPSGLMTFMCWILTLSSPVELLFLLCFIDT